MRSKIFREIPFNFNMEMLNEVLNLRGRKSLLKAVEKLLEETKRIANVKAIFFQSKIADKTETNVTVDSNIFESQLLMGYVDKGDTVFPYIVTVGTELDDYAKTLEDGIDQLMIDELMNLLVNVGKDFVADKVKEETGWELTQDYVPGNGEEWSTEEQTRLFNMFGGDSGEIGVTLGDHAFVLPGRSTIGILSKK